MVSTRAAGGTLVAVAALTSCDIGRDPKPIQVRVAVAVEAVRVEIYKDDCRPVGSMYRNQCAVKTWAFFPEWCLPDHSCVKTMRLERDGEVLAQDDEAPNGGTLFPTQSPGGATLTLEGCEQPIVIQLPAPLTASAELTQKGKEATISWTASESDVTPNDATLAPFESFATATTLIPGPAGVAGICLAEGTSVNVEVSEDTPVVSSWLLASPETEQAPGAVVQVQRAAYFNDLGAVSDAVEAVLFLARLSPAYADAQKLCDELAASCESADANPCLEFIMLRQTAFPACESALDALTTCNQTAANCSDETLLGGDPCQTEETTLNACVQRQGL